MSYFFNTFTCMPRGVCSLLSLWTVAGAVGGGGVCVGCCPLPVQLSSVGRCRASWRSVGGDGYIVVGMAWASLLASWAAWGGCRRASGRGVGCRALWVLWRAVGRSCCIVWDRCRASCPRCCCRSWQAMAGPGCRWAGSAGRGGVCPLSSLGCWRCCLASSRGRDHVSGGPACGRGPVSVRVSSPTA